MQIDNGGLLLWVRTRDVEAEVRAVDILTKHSSRDVHVHTLAFESADAEWKGDDNFARPVHSSERN
jgi:hypothetical protein